MMTRFNSLILDIDTRGVATLTLNRPQKHNALNAELITELHHACDLLAENHSVRVVVLTGAGKTFCAGGDINWFASNIDKNRDERIEQSATLAAMLHALNTLPKPLIGRINGAAWGGGVGMISVCDFAVGLSNAKFGLTEVRLGLLPANIAPYVIKRIGAANARATMLSGATFTGSTAEKIGLLNIAIDDMMMDECVEKIISDHLEAAPNAIAQTKRLIDFVDTHSTKDNMKFTATALADAWDHEEGRTGVKSFLDKRLPPWRSHS